MGGEVGRISRSPNLDTKNGHKGSEKRPQDRGWVHQQASNH